jgi:hypothetical protein
MKGKVPVMLHGNEARISGIRPMAIQALDLSNPRNSEAERLKVRNHQFICRW